MKQLRTILKSLGILILFRPFRGFVTWGCQRGYLTSKLRNVLPGRWVHEPFTIYGDGWTCRWFPTEYDVVGHWVFWAGLREWEKETAPVVLEEIRRSRCFIDIGANTGMYTVLGCTVNPDVRVVAIEPVPRIFASMVNNVAQNNFTSRVTALNVALSESNGSVPFHESDSPTMGSLEVAGYKGKTGKVIQVQCRTLDSIVEALQVEPDFLKIDVEGFEHIVLKGGRRVLEKFRPRIVLEANPGDPSDAVTDILSKYGYRFQNITDDGLEARNEIIPVEAYHNWLCEPAG